MDIDLIENAFLQLDLSPKASKQDILLAVMKKIKEKPAQMAELASAQSLLLNPRTRFLIELFYYPDFEKMNRSVH